MAMRWLLSFTQGEALTEVFVEGHNPRAQRKLETADVDALRQQMYSTETLQAYVIGRIVLAGRGVWALTDQALYVPSATGRQIDRVPLAELQGFEAERGGYGHTVRVGLPERSCSLYGVDRDMAQQMHAAMQRLGVASRFDERQARSYAWRQASRPGWPQDCLRDAQLRLNPAAIAA